MASFKIPPRLESHTFTGVAASGGGEDWLDIEGIPVDPAVNGFIFDKNDQKLLLVFRTGGFAMGRYVPVIASLPDGKDPEKAIKEATKEQTGGVEATEISDVGGFFITIDGQDGARPYVSFAQAMRISAWVGEPSETENKKPEWVATPTRTEGNAALSTFPIDRMFEDERYWYPHFFAGRRVIGRVDYSAPENPGDIVGKLNRYWFGFTD